MKLKELLKRSNATSLSEILQQHNLSLTDLLNGGTKAVSVLKSESSSDAHKSKSKDSKDTSENSRKSESTQEQKESHENKGPENKSDLEKTTEDIEDSQQLQKRKHQTADLEPQSTGKPHSTRIMLNENSFKIVPKRRFPGGLRRKLRLRPTIQNGLKAELSRDLIAQTARKYHDNRNLTKSKEWKEILPSMNTTITQDSVSKNENSEISTTTTASPEETTIIEIYPSTIYDETVTINERLKDDELMVTDTTEASTVSTQETTTAEVITTTEKIKMIHLERPGGYRTGTRRQPINRRSKRKRLKQKNSTSELSVEKDEHLTDFSSMLNLVSSSDFNARTQTPMSTLEDTQGLEDLTTVDDLSNMNETKNIQKFSRNSTTSTTHKYIDKTSVRSTTEETAKVEIEEILNDTRSKSILIEVVI